MRFSYVCLRFAAMLGLAALAACSLDPGEPHPVEPVDPPDDATITFVHDGTLTLAPGETTIVQVAATPPAAYEVSFYLVGDALDASLSQSSVISDPQGGASVALRAPNRATYFALRASLQGGHSTELPVAVSDKGFGTLDLHPINPGPRDTELWVANAVAGTTCDALAAVLPAGPAEAPPPVSSPPGEPLWIEDVPVGPNLAVYVRGGFFMWGCADVTTLVAGSRLSVDVRITNKPIDLAGALLDVTLGFAPDPEPYASLLDDTEQQMLDALLGGQPDDASALLAAMSAASSDPDGFDAASTASDWPTLVASHLSSQSATLSDAVLTWLDDGMAAQPADIAGQLETVDPAGYALFTLERVGTVTPVEAGIPDQYLMTLTADPDDTVRLGGTLFWMPSLHLGAAAATLAADQYPTLGTMGEVLGEQLGCADLASTLGGFDDCDPSCMQELCTAALEQLWHQALDASVQAQRVGSITLQASGGASFDDHAGLTGFEGTWLGSVTNGLSEATVQGVVSAQEAQQSPAQ